MSRPELNAKKNGLAVLLSMHLSTRVLLLEQLAKREAKAEAARKVDEAQEESAGYGYTNLNVSKAQQQQLKEQPTQRDINQASTESRIGRGVPHENAFIVVVDINYTSRCQFYDHRCRATNSIYRVVWSNHGTWLVRFRLTVGSSAGSFSDSADDVQDREE